LDTEHLVGLGRRAGDEVDPTATGVLEGPGLDLLRLAPRLHPVDDAIPHAAPPLCPECRKSTGAAARREASERPRRTYRAAQRAWPERPMSGKPERAPAPHVSCGAASVARAAHELEARGRAGAARIVRRSERGPSGP